MMITHDQTTSGTGRLAAVAYAAQVAADERERRMERVERAAAEMTEAGRRKLAAGEIRRAVSTILPGVPVDGLLWASRPDYGVWLRDLGVADYRTPHAVVAGRLVLVLCGGCLHAGLLPTEAGGRTATLVDLAAATWLTNSRGGYVTVYDAADLAPLLAGETAGETGGAA